MKPGTRLRRSILLFVALAATVAAAGWVGGEEEMAPSPVVRPAGQVVASRETATAAAPEPATVDVEKLQRRPVSREFGDIFPGRSWQPPPPPPAKPPPPRAPPLPFSFFGRMVEDGKTVVFLSRRDQTFAAKAGDTIAGSYRVEEIGPATVVLTYLPLKERQVLNIGAIN